MTLNLKKLTLLEDTLVLDILGSMTLNSGEKFHKRAKKLLNKLKNGTDELFYTKIELEDISNKLDEVQLLEKAIKNNQHITFIYDFESYKKELEVKPLKITNYEGFWYLVALDSRDDNLKKYYLKNISTIKLLDKKFKTDTDMQKLLENSISIWFDKDTKPYKVKLHIEKEIAKYFKRKPISKTQKLIKEGDDGSLEVELFITHDMEIIPIIKYWLPHIKVIEPMRIRESIIKDLKSYVNISNLPNKPLSKLILIL